MPSSYPRDAARPAPPGAGPHVPVPPVRSDAQDTAPHDLAIPGRHEALHAVADIAALVAGGDRSGLPAPRPEQIGRELTALGRLFEAVTECVADTTERTQRARERQATRRPDRDALHAVDTAYRQLTECRAPLEETLRRLKRARDGLLQKATQGPGGSGPPRSEEQPWPFI